MYYRTSYESLIGTLILVGTERDLVGLWMSGQKYFLEPMQGIPMLEEENDVLLKAKAWLDRYFNKERPDISELTLSPQGSAFRKHVWKILCEIPYGQVTTYGAIAKRIALEDCRSSMSAQAVGNAVGHNPISIIIPCHRVIGTTGKLTGYAGGIERKLQLLELEDVDVFQFSKSINK